jgi:O-antigen biosynthesis protein
VTTFSVVIPVKDGERYLAEVLSAVQREGVEEIIVIDSGSSDASVEIARASGATVLEIPPNEFGHGRTRNLGAERASGDLICFVTQDATPLPGWRASYDEAFALDPKCGAAYGPHVPRRDATPMIARELEEFFARFSPDGTPVVQRSGDPPFLSNVNACYSRVCWQTLRFRDLAYAEDQAFGADLLAAGWSKVYHPGAAVLHSHNYGLANFMKRYFDEYRGLRESTGHVEPFGVRMTLGHVRRSVGGDLQWLRARGAGVRHQARWMASSSAHHGGRRAFSALGSRAHQLPPKVRQGLSLERRADVAATPAGPTGSTAPPGVDVGATRAREFYAAAAHIWRQGPAPLLHPIPGMAERARLRIAMVIPAFSRGSGGHALLFQIFSRLEQRGHVCSVWVHDYAPHLVDLWPGVLRQNIVDFFGPIAAPVYNGFAEWHGADVVLATGWQTVHPALALDRCLARVYVVNDHEPEFYATSAESVLAADTYRQGLFCIAGSPWLRDLLVERYGATAEAFEYGVDHLTYRPRPIVRRRDTVIYYARTETARRAVPIGLLALAELHRRRPDVRILLFGSTRPIDASFPYRHLGILSPEQLSWLYSEATAGLCLSLTNFSLMPKEMMACGLPCVELAGASAESIFGRTGPLELAELNPFALADALERLLTDEELWGYRSQAGVAYASAHSWERATDAVEAGIRHALRLREREAEVTTASADECATIALEP